MRITENRLRSIIRSVIRESIEGCSLEDYQRKISSMNIQYDYCSAYSDETSCGFIVNGKEIDIEDMTFPSPNHVLEMLVYNMFPEIEDEDLEELVAKEVAKKLGKDQLRKLYEDLGRASSEASQYMSREFGKDDEYNPYWYYTIKSKKGI